MFSSVIFGTLHVVMPLCSSSTGSLIGVIDSFFAARSPLGLAKTPLSARGLKPHQQGGSGQILESSSPCHVQSMSSFSILLCLPAVPSTVLMGKILDDADFLEHSQNESRSRSNMLWSLVQPFFKYFFFYSRGTGSPMNANRPASPEGSQVNIMGIHTVPGSPNTLHRTVDTNTPPSSALQRRLGQASPSLARHPPPGAVPSSPLIGRSPKMALAGVPPSPLMGRRAMASTPDELGAASHQGSSQPPATPAFPVSPQLPEKRHLSSGDAENKNLTLTPVSGGSTPNLSGALPDVFKSIYGEDLEDETRMNVKFVQDTSRFWYKPDISREQAINLLKDREPGAFIIRDSHSFRGAYGLAMKVACPPPTVQQNKKVGDMTNELVRHFLIETSAKGVRLKGCPNEPYFGERRSGRRRRPPLALSCKLMTPTKGRPCPPATQLLKQGAACNVLYINSVDMESLTGPQAVAKAISQTLASNPLPAATTMLFRVSAQGITLTDSQRKIFFRRHYPISTVTFCNVYPKDRKLFGFVARKQGSTTDVSHLFAELDPDQPASAIVSFISKVMKR
uniref:SH2 domain-containing protein n=1 Tax=Salarias fasciatus TaxID=181472 RepID=A0A672GBX0_SALFA